MHPSSPSEFFADIPKDGLLQGDIVLSPSTVLWREDRAPCDFHYYPIAPDLGETVAAPLWNPHSEGDGVAPVVFHESRWSPVMVLSHDCEMEKEFNQRASSLIADGFSREEAEAIASEDESLDRFVVVAPLLSYGELPQDQHEGVRSGQRIGYFPVPPFAAVEMDETLVHLDRACTVDRLLLTRFAKIASLTPMSVGVLRFKLAECYAARDLSAMVELQALVGKRITHVQLHQRSKRSTALHLHLDNGQIAHLDIKTPRESLLAELRRRMKIR